MLKVRLGLVLGVIALVAGITALTAVADDSPSSSPAACVVNAGQQGVDVQGTANAISGAADDVESEAERQQADDDAGDQHGADDADEHGEQNQCGEHGGQGNDHAESGEHGGQGNDQAENGDVEHDDGADD